MESPAARSVALHAARSIRRQLNPVLNSGVLDQQVVASGFCALGANPGVVDSRPSAVPTRSDEVDVLSNAKYVARDRAIWQLDGPIGSVRSGELGCRPAGWTHLHVINALLGSKCRPEFVKHSGLSLDDLMLNPAQREQKKQSALVRSVLDLPRVSGDLTESSREASQLATIFVDCSVQAVRPRTAGGHGLASLLGCVEGGQGLSVLQRENIRLECDSVKRKRKKKMNKHKQRKLRRRDRHRN
ncbi:hypothetical protein MPTK1_5g23010 [Marchantia polymorpha subsp. ruderalis]|nr:hypothetical protein MARPO_0010s0155 [Marchantia polymorpha]BBN12804.1 hypothetical protein Mp_5g23010 [Marchantia polymorpha subsp. ruderalis]|eukprot:PTQ46774.1 hypothetical protein MARPO_0010s0155 [Marchantia polymorpha]